MSALSRSLVLLSSATLLLSLTGSAMATNPWITGSGNHTQDWRDYEKVTPVYNQGQCNSSYAFAVTEALESYLAIQGGTLTPLSAQQIISCDSGNNACSGGDATSAVNYIMQAGGLDSLSSYPYTSDDGSVASCAFNSNNIVGTAPNIVQITGETAIDRENAIRTALQHGPVIVALQGDFTNYTTSSGVNGYLMSQHSSQFCNENTVTWAVITGYVGFYPGQATATGTVWNVRTSFGTDFGFNGYMKIQAGVNFCNIADNAYQIVSQ